MSTPFDAAVPSDKLVAPLNAPRGASAGVGVQPGVSGNIILAQYVVVFGTAGGIFIYAGSPGPGNPPLYTFGNVTQDPYRNPVKPGIWAGQPGAIQVGIQAQGGFAEVFFIPAGNYAADASAGMVQVSGQAILQLRGAQTTATGQPTSDSVALFFWDHGAGTHADLQAVYFYTDGSLINLFDGNYAGLSIPCASVTAVHPGTGTSPSVQAVSETWQNITVDAGWTIVNQPQYRLLPDGNIQARGLITRAGTAVQTDINSGNPIPTAYRPGVTRYYRTPMPADLAGSVEIQLTGVFTMRASGFAATQAILDGIYSI